VSRYASVWWVACLCWAVACGSGSTPSAGPSKPPPLEEPAAPSAPRTVEAVAGLGEATVTWSAPERDGGRPVTGYQVEGEPHDATLQVLVEGTHARVTGLRAGASYTFTVVALNAVGPSTPSRSPAITLPDVPGAPPAPSVTRWDGQVRVEWAEPGLDGGRPVSGYRVHCAPQGLHVDVTAPERSVLVPGLTLGEPATCTVRARNAVGEGPESAASAPVVPATRPAAPLNVTARAGIREVTVTWTPPEHTGGVPLTGYEVRILPASSALRVDASARSATYKGLTDGTSFTLSVAALNEVGASAATSAPAQRTLDVPQAPRAVTAQARERSVRVAWEAPLEDGGAPITGYAVERQPGGAITRLDASARDVLLTELSSTQAYTFTVFAASDVGRGPSSASTPPVQPLPAPARVTALEVPSSAAGCLSVTYSLAQPEGLAADVVIEVDPGTGSFRRVAQAGSTDHEGLLARSTSAQGASHRFLWNRALDVPASAAARLRVSAQVAGTERQTRTLSLALPAATARCETRMNALRVRPLDARPSVSAVADFDGDGKPDLAVVTDKGPALRVIKGLGHGGFQLDAAREIVRAQGSLSAVAAADLDADGRMDLLWMSSTSGLNVARGRGDGSFDAPRQYDVPLSSGRGLAVADFNGDGHPDVAVPGSASAVFFLYNTGGGQLGATGTAGPGGWGGARAFSVADLNEDGRPDLVAQVPDSGYATLLSTAQGTFLFHSEAGALGGVAVADVDGDGHLDLALAEDTAATTRLLVRRGNGRGDFAAPEPVASWPNLYDNAVRDWTPLVAADLDGDGAIDLAVAIPEAERLGVVWGRGDGTWGPAEQLSGGRRPMFLATADLDTDGVADLLSLQEASRDVRSWRGGARRLAAPEVLGTGVFSVGDLNGDGWMDLVSSPSARQLQVSLGGPTGFTPLPLVDTGGAVDLVLLARLDADAALDVVILPGTGTTVRVLRGQGDGTLGAATTLELGARAWSVSAGDMDADGHTDLIFAGDVTVDGVPWGQVRLMRGLGDGSFRPPSVLLSTNDVPGRVQVTDVEGDGTLDIVVPRDAKGQGAAVLLGRGDGTFRTGASLGCGGDLTLLALRVEDVDQDGVRDLLCIGRSDTREGEVLRVRQGWGGGEFAPGLEYPTGGNGAQLEVVDFDGDGTLDVLSPNPGRDSVSLHRGLGDGRFALPETFSAPGYSAFTLSVLDADGDGRQDVLVGGGLLNPGVALLRQL
jgi:hypothetical protein